MIKNVNGITIKELKQYIANLPETNVDGEDFEVWLQSGDNVSSPCTSIKMLTKTEYGSDILLYYN